MMLVLFIVVTLIIILYFIITFLGHKKDDLEPPGPWNLPILGSLYILDPEKPYLALTKLAQKYGPIYSIKLGNIKTVVISDFKLLKKVLMKDEALGRPQLYIMDYVCRGKGITFAHLNLWKEQRKFLTDFLRSVGAAKISPKREVLENEVRKSVGQFVQLVKTQENSNTFLTEAVTNYVSSVTSTLFLGKSWPRDHITEFIQVIKEVIEVSVVGGPLNFLPFLRLLPRYAKVLSTLRNSFNKTHRFMEKFIKNSDQLVTDEKSDDSSCMVKAFMRKKLTCNSEEVYNVEQLRYLIADMFGASTETTTTSILWTLLYLVKYEEVQEKVRQELASVLQGETPQMEDLQNLPYTEATLAEVSRIRTTVAMGTPHLAVEDFYIDNFKILKNTMIMPLLWAIHMDPKIWNQPEDFRPNRFLNDQGKFYQPEGFLPFSVGKRICIGEQLAKMMIFLFVATILQNFKIKSCDSDIDLAGICGITLLPKPQRLSFVQVL